LPYSHGRKTMNTLIDLLQTGAILCLAYVLITSQKGNK